MDKNNFVIKKIKNLINKVAESRRLRIVIFALLSLSILLFSLPSLSNFTSKGNTGYIGLSKCLTTQFQVGCDDPSAFRTPGYPLFLGILGQISDYHPLFIGLAQFSLLILIGLMTWKLVELVFDDDILGWIAGMIALVHPYLYFLTTRVADTALFTLFFLSGVYILFKNIKLIKKDETSKLWLIFLGFICAVTTLIRPSGIWLVISSFTILSFYLLRQYNYKLFLKNVALSSLAFLLLFSPWVIRNYVQFNSFIPLTTNGGINLLKGHNPHYQLIHPMWDIDIMGSYLKKQANLSNELQTNKYFTNKAIKNFLNDPGYYAVLDLKKIFDWFRPQKVPRIYQSNDNLTFNANGNQKVEVSVSYSILKELIYITYWSFVIFFALVSLLFGILKSQSQNREYMFMLLIIILIYSIEAALAFPDTRFRVPLDPLIIILSVLGLKLLCDWSKNKNDLIKSLIK